MSELSPMGDDLSIRGDVEALQSRRKHSAEVRNAALSAGLAFAAAGGAFALGARGAAHAMLALPLPLAALVGLEANRGREERGSAPFPVTWRAAVLLSAAAIIVVVTGDVGERTGVPLLWLASLGLTAFILWPQRTDTSRPLLITLAVVSCLALCSLPCAPAPFGPAAFCLGLAAWSDRRFRDAERRLAMYAGGANLDALEVRLAELSRLTEHYARFSEYGVGLGGVPVGLCWLGAGTALALGAHRLAQVCLALAAPAVALGLRAASGFYQRHGVVRRPSEMSGIAPTQRFLAVQSVAVIVIVMLTVALVARRPDATALSALQLAVVWAACLGLAAALSLDARVRSHGLLVPGIAAGTSITSSVPPWDTRDIGVLLFLGAVWSTLCLLSHLQYWRLERRLAALRRTMP